MRPSTRILSLLLAVLLLATLLPLEQLRLVPQAAADDSKYNLTIDFDYEKKNNVTDAAGALTLKGNEAMTSAAVDADYWQSSYNQFNWKHVTSWTVKDHDEGSLRKLLVSTDPKDKYISLTEDDSHSFTSKAVWEPMVITTDKVLDLNGHKLEIRYDANRKSSGYAQTTHAEYHNCTCIEIENGATLTIIDSSAWRGEGTGGKGTGLISFTGYMVSPYKYDINYYTTRDLFHVNDGNLVIYGGTFQAGRKKDQLKSNFSMSKLRDVIGSAVEMGVSVAEYATGLNTATAGYQDLLDKATNKSAMKETGDTGEKDDGTEGSSTVTPRDGTNQEPATETKKDTPEKAENRNQTVDEKSKQKDANIDAGKPGTKEGENKANDKSNGKDDTQTKLAEAQNNIVNQALNKDKIMGIVDNAFSLATGIAGLVGSDEKSRVTQSIKGTVVKVGASGSFVSYGGTYKGYGSTPNTRNATIEVSIVPSSLKPYDHSKYSGGVAYIYDGSFEAYNGANVFNFVRQNAVQYATQYVRDKYGNISQPQRVLLDTKETNEVEVIYYKNQDELSADTEGKVTPIPISTANVQVRGGTFRCFYDLMNVATKLDGDSENFAKFPGTMGAVNLGIESFNSDLIYDGRIQIVDRYGDGSLVLLDDVLTESDATSLGQGLYHYRLFCGDTELRVKSYLDVYPNLADTNTSHSMQLATYYGNGKRTSTIFADNEDNIRAPYRQTENYFDYMFDATAASSWSVMPNFHFQATDTEAEKMDALNSDVYGTRLANSEVWYYPEPLDADGHPIPDPTYGETYFTAARKSGAGLNLSARDYQSELQRVISKAESLGYLKLTQRENSEKVWKIIRNQLADKSTIQYKQETHNGVRTNMKYFVYKVYRVDPLTRESISEGGYGTDIPLLQVRYGASDDSLKCKLPLKEVEARIKLEHPEWQGYQSGEMYRIVLDVEQYVGIGYQGSGVFGAQLPVAKSESTILFRCFSKDEQEDTNSVYKAHDFTPVQWLNSAKAGTTARIQVVNGKAGMTDYRGDTNVFDVYYQWWEVDKDGNPIRMLAGTDNIYNAANGDYEDHRPESWNVGKDGKTYVNTVNPKDPLASTYGSNGLPKNSMTWTNRQLHAYLSGTNRKSELTWDGTDNLYLGNNNVFAFNTDSCYIPEDMGGRYLRVKVVAQNISWPMAYDEYQTFWSHVVKIPEAEMKPLNAELEVSYIGSLQYATYDKPASFRITDVSGLSNGETITDVRYYLTTSKEFTGLTATNAQEIPTVQYPQDFYLASELEGLRAYNKVDMYAQLTTSKGRSFLAKARFSYQVEAKELRAPGLGYYNASFEDIQNIVGERSSIRPFWPVPINASVGIDYSSASATNPGVASLDATGYVIFGGDKGSSVISMKGPDGKTLSYVVNVYSGIHSVEIAGLKAPALGQTLPQSFSIPEDSGYTVSEFYWTENRDRSEEKLSATAKAENYHVYTANLVLTPKDTFRFDGLTTLPAYVEAELADGSFDVASGLTNAYGYVSGNSDCRIVEIEDGKLLVMYSFKAISGGAASTISEIYLDFPTQVNEGENITEWMERVNIYTNGDDSQLTVENAQVFATLDSTNPMNALGNFALTELDSFVPGVQSGFQLMLTIPNELVASFPTGSNAIQIYINGEAAAKATAINSKSVWAIANNSLTVVPGSGVSPIPAYSIDYADLVVGSTLNVPSLLHCDEPGAELKLISITASDLDLDQYLSFDEETQELTPKKVLQDKLVSLKFEVSFDTDQDGVRDYVKTHTTNTYIYSAANAPARTDATQTVTAYEPDGTAAYADTFVTRNTWVSTVGPFLAVPEIENAFISSVTVDGASTPGSYRYGADRITCGTAFRTNQTVTIKTVYADDIQIHPGASKVFAYLLDEDGNDVEGVNISVDGVHFTAASEIDNLAPNTEYTLYYKQGVNGQVYTKIFRTAGEDYNVYVGRNPVTDQNLGILEVDGWHYNPATKTLTLKDFLVKDAGLMTISSALYSIILSKDDITLELLGDNYIEASTYSNFIACVYSDGNITVTGPGNLTMTGKYQDLGWSKVYSTFGMESAFGSIYLNGSGVQTMQNLRLGYVVLADTGKITYSNGTLDFQTDGGGNAGDMIQDTKVAACLSFNKISGHTLTITNGAGTVISESGFASYLTTSGHDMNVTFTMAHNYNQRNETTPYLKGNGDCTKGCTYYYSCTCGAISPNKTFTSAKGGHTLEHHEAQPATCTTPGWDAYDTCAKCAYSTYSEHEYAALGHVWVHHEGKQPTCDEDGYPDYDECSRCGLSSKLIIPGGKRAVSNTQRDIEITDPEILKWCATGHELQRIPVEPATCTAAGTVEYYTCVHCGKNYAEEEAVNELSAADLVAPVLGHAWGPWTVTKEATETAAGSMTRSCDRCGETETKTIPATQPVNPFVDVPSNKYYYKAVLWAVSNGVTSGTDATHFSPNKDCTREQIVSFLWKATGSEEPSTTDCPFTDVKPGKYYVKPVLWAVEHGVTGGVSSTLFGVGRACTREQAMTFLWKACGAPEPESGANPFTDVKEGKYYYKAVMWAVQNGVTGGVSATQFGVGRTCTRAQIVTFLYAALGD